MLVLEKANICRGETFDHSLVNTVEITTTCRRVVDGKRDIGDKRGILKARGGDIEGERGAMLTDDDTRVD